MASPAFHESLPYIDPEPSPADLDAARALIAAEQSSLPAPSLPPLRATAFSPIIATELERIAAAAAAAAQTPSSTLSNSHPQNQNTTTTTTPQQQQQQHPAPSSALDLSRYELQPDNPQAPLRQPLSTAAVSSTYLAHRAHNLALLDAHGKNAWLLANYNLESDLRAIEADLAHTKTDIDLVNAQRARAQAHVKAEMDRLGSDWRDGVGRVLETELAVEEMRQRVREELRRGG